jgi:hypothetical protein
MLAAREGSSELRRRRSRRRRQRTQSAAVGRGRERRRWHYDQRRRHRRMCRGRRGDNSMQKSSSHRSQTTSTFRSAGRYVYTLVAPPLRSSWSCPGAESRPPSVRWGSTWGGACGVRGTLSSDKRPRSRQHPRVQDRVRRVSRTRRRAFFWRNTITITNYLGNKIGALEFLRQTYQDKASQCVT